MTNDKGIEIPSFMAENHPRQHYKTDYYEHEEQLKKDYQYAKAQSKNPKKIKAKKTKEKVSPSDMLKRYAIIFGLGALTATTLIEYENIVNLPEKFKKMNIESDYLAPYYDIIQENRSLTDDKEHYFYNASKIGKTYKEMIENGTPEEVIAYVSATALDADFEQDELYTVFNYTFNETPEECALSNGYTTVYDKALEKNVKNNILRQANIAEYEQSLESMLTDSETNMQENEKGIGGK